MRTAGPPAVVDDYPGVARLSGMWADEAAAEAPAEPLWQPSEAAEAAWQNAESEAVTPTSVTPLVPPASDADQAYLDFLTAGAGSGHAETDEASAEVTSVMPYPVPGEDAVEGYQAFEGYREFSNNGYGTNGHQGDQGDYQDDEYQHDGYQIVDYQQDDLSEPAEPVYATAAARDVRSGSPVRTVRDSLWAARQFRCPAAHQWGHADR